MVDLQYYAHTREDTPPEEWEPLRDHLDLVAHGDGDSFPGARGFADAFGAADWGEILGLWHDVGTDHKGEEGGNSHPLSPLQNRNCFNPHSRTGSDLKAIVSQMRSFAR